MEDLSIRYNKDLDYTTPSCLEFWMDVFRRFWCFHECTSISCQQKGVHIFYIIRLLLSNIVRKNNYSIQDIWGQEIDTENRILRWTITLNAHYCRSRSSMLSAILRSSFEAVQANESLILQFVSFLVHQKKSIVIVFLRNVGFYIFFSVVWIIHGVFVCLPHAPSLKCVLVAALTSSNCSLIWVQSDTFLFEMHWTVICFAMWKFNCSVWPKSSWKEVWVQVVDWYRALFDVQEKVKCAIGRVQEILKLNETVFFHVSRCIQFVKMFIFLLSGASRVRKAEEFPSKL